jgi:hypothetical protein
MDKTIDMCGLANFNKQNFLVKMIIAEIEKSGNLKFTCPIKKVFSKILKICSNIKNRPFLHG